MATIKCNNTRNEAGTVIKCDRFALIIPDCLLKSLRDNPGQKIITRCPTCPSYQRWAAIYVNSSSRLVWELIPKPENFDEELVFDDLINSLQVG